MTQEIAQAEQTQVTVRENSQPQIISIIADLAKDKDADLAKFERLIQLKKEMDEYESKKAFDDDYSKMKPELPVVLGKHYNEQTKHKFAKLEDINEVIDPILGKYGFGTSSRVIAQTNDSVTMRIELRHRCGHVENMELSMPIDNKGAQGSTNKTVVQGIASTIKYLRRIGTCSLLNISAGEEDGRDDDGNGSARITTEQAADMDNRLRALSNVALSNFLAWAKVEKLIDIDARNYATCVSAIKRMEDDKAKKGQR